MSDTRKVMVATPCYDGRADVWYFNSLFQTAQMSQSLNVNIIPIWLSYDALVQRARNDCMALALEYNCDDIIFIDSDVEWQPEWFFQLLDYPVDVVGGTYRKKTDDSEDYVMKLHNYNIDPDPVTGLVRVAGLGTGFLRFSKKAMQSLWDCSVPYNETQQGKNRRWIFEVIVENHNLISEDIWVCRKLQENGFDIWLAPHMTLSHVGIKKFQGDFQSWLTSSVLHTQDQSTAKRPIKDLYR